MSDLVTQTKGVSGARLPKSDVLHFVNPKTRRSACNLVDANRDDVLTYRLDIGSPSFTFLCRDCYRSTSFVDELPGSVRMKYEQAIQRMKTMSAGFKEMTGGLSNEQREEVEQVIEDIMEDEWTPIFYAVSGSHLRDLETDESDLDIRGFHIAPAEHHYSVGDVTDSVKVNTDHGDPEEHENEHVDLVSYELKKYGTFLVNNHPHLIESLFRGDKVIDAAPQYMSQIRRTIDKNLPLDIPYNYYTMAEANYENLLSPNSDDYEPTAKNYLLVLRCLLGAKFVKDQHLIDPRPRVLSESVLGGSNMVDELIAHKKDSPGERLDRQLEDDAQALVLDLMEAQDYAREADKEDFRKSVNSWMKDLRSEVE